MSEFEALNLKTGEVEVLSISRYCEISKDDNYRVFPVNPFDI